MNVDEFRYLYFDLSGDGNISSIRQDAAFYQRCCGGKASSIRRSFLDFDFDGFVTIGFHTHLLPSQTEKKTMSKVSTVRYFYKYVHFKSTQILVLQHHSSHP